MYLVTSHEHHFSAHSSKSSKVLNMCEIHGSSILPASFISDYISGV